MEYTIKTTDGAVARATATRPYKAAWIGRDKDGKAVKGAHSEFTINPKPMIGSKQYPQRECQVAVWTYERVVAEPKK